MRAQGIEFPTTKRIHAPTVEPAPSSAELTKHIATTDTTHHRHKGRRESADTSRTLHQGNDPSLKLAGRSNHAAYQAVLGRV